MIFMIHGHPDISPLMYFISPHTLQASVFWPAARSSCPASPCWSRAACSSPPRTSLMRGPTPAWRATPGASTRPPLTWWCGVSVHGLDSQEHYHILLGHTWKTKYQNSPSQAFFLCHIMFKPRSISSDPKVLLCASWESSPGVFFFLRETIKKQNTICQPVI